LGVVCNCWTGNAGGVRTAGPGYPCVYGAEADCGCDCGCNCGKIKAHNQKDQVRNYTGQANRNKIYCS